MTSEQLNEFILFIYRESHRVPLVQFKEHMLLALQDLLNFDKAVWLTGSTLDGVTPNGIATINVEDQMISDYELYKEGDPLVPYAIKHPLKAFSLTRINNYENWLRSDNHLHYAKKYDMRYVVSIADDEPDSSLISAITLYRNESFEDFNDKEMKVLETIFPHLVEAHKQSLFLFLANPPEESDKQTNWSYAVCDEHGVLIQADSYFSHIMHHQWPQWSGTQLPEEIVAALNNKHFEFDALSMRCERSGDVISIKLAHRSNVDSLTPQEFKISEKIKEGLSNKEIAKAMSLSPSTVKNHLSNIMRKLSVNKRSQLASIMSEHS